MWVAPTPSLSKQMVYKAPGKSWPAEFRVDLKDDTIEPMEVSRVMGVPRKKMKKGWMLSGSENPNMGIMIYHYLHLSWSIISIRLYNWSPSWPAGKFTSRSPPSRLHLRWRWSQVQYRTGEHWPWQSPRPPPGFLVCGDDWVSTDD